jgi:hypothetical protein
LDIHTLGVRTTATARTGRAACAIRAIRATTDYLNGVGGIIPIVRNRPRIEPG